MSGRGAQVRLRGLGKRFDQRQVLRGIDLDVRPSELLVIVGRSGCGKSTLLRLLCGLEQPSEGTLELDAGGTAAIDAVRVVFQEPRLLPWRTVVQNVSVGARDAATRALARSVLKSVGLDDRADDYPATLSGGQRQRVALARALLHQPALMLLDEPFGALDALTRIEAQQLVESLWRERGFSAVLVTHDVEEAVLLGDRVLVFDEGRVVRELPIDVPRPRTRDNPEVGRLAGLLLQCIFERRRAPAGLSDPRDPRQPAPAPSALIDRPLGSGAV